MPSLSAPQTSDIGAVDIVTLRLAKDLIGRCRGFGLKCGLLAVLTASARSPEEREAFATEFLAERSNYLDAIARQVAEAAFLCDLKPIEHHRRVVCGFRDRLAALSDKTVSFDMDQAIDLADAARAPLMTAIYAIIDHLGSMIAVCQSAEMSRTAEKAALVDGMLGEVSRIGRMIGLISINASVEAARTGGTSGRAFQVIAEEVRDLAQQSSTLLTQTKTRLAEKESVDRSSAVRGLMTRL